MPVAAVLAAYTAVEVDVLLSQVTRTLGDRDKLGTAAAVDQHKPLDYGTFVAVIVVEVVVGVKGFVVAAAVVVVVVVVVVSELSSSYSLTVALTGHVGCAQFERRQEWRWTAQLAESLGWNGAASQ
jgi:hypothetical protein